jgi:transcriptional regulator with PAS, ATPase and Fis domain
MNKKYVEIIVNSAEFNLQKMERDTIIEARRRHPKDTMDEIAKKLGISTRTLSRKIEDYGIDFPTLK